MCKQQRGYEKGGEGGTWRERVCVFVCEGKRYITEMGDRGTETEREESAKELRERKRGGEMKGKKRKRDPRPI